MSRSVFFPPFPKSGENENQNPKLKLCRKNRACKGIEFNVTLRKQHNGSAVSIGRLHYCRAVATAFIDHDLASYSSSMMNHGYFPNYTIDCNTARTVHCQSQCGGKETTEWFGGFNRTSTLL
jgi:hypothetical protein